MARIKRLKSRNSLRDGEPCGHPGCLHHILHPCEGCGRIAGRRIKEELWKLKEPKRLFLVG